jgi:hypothetical protein
LCKGIKNAQKVADAITAIYAKTGIPFEVYVSKISETGVTLQKNSKH